MKTVLDLQLIGEHYERQKRDAEIILALANQLVEVSVELEKLKAQLPKAPEAPKAK